MAHGPAAEERRRSVARRSRARVRRDLSRYRALVRVSDALLVVVSILIAAVTRFQGDELTQVATGGGGPSAAVRVMAPFAVLAWIWALTISTAYDPRVMGFGNAEYAAVSRATLMSFAALAIVSFAFKLQLARGFVVIALPVGLAVLLLNHWIWRKWLAHQRRQGRMLYRVLVVGDAAALTHLIRTLDGDRAAGYQVIGACSSEKKAPTYKNGEPVPVFGGELEAAAVAEAIQADVVACTTSRSLGSLAVRRLAWQLEGSETEMIVVPDVIDVAGPRITTRPVNGTPLLLIEQPSFGGLNLFLKTVMDKVLCFGGVVVLLPVFVAIAIAIKSDDGGPIFFRQERVGVNGRHFHMIKFRSMRVGADREHAAMMAKYQQENADRGPMFKLENDPRITKVGGFLRRTSLDELPQLFNILAGEMSLVGPRPPLPSEVEGYDFAAKRRLLVKPGLTGMWQVSGRSNLSWEESVRLDLYYVENWTLSGDLIIIFRTFKAVMAREGAY